jgi:hypothetical protein
VRKRVCVRVRMCAYAQSDPSLFDKVFDCEYTGTWNFFRFESALFCSYVLFKHATLGTAIRTTAAAKLPPAIAEVVDVVSPTTRLPAPFHPIRGRVPRAQWPGLLGTNPTTIRAAYGMGAIEANSSNKLVRGREAPV